MIETLSNLIRLSYWSRIKSVVPATFHDLLPPAPEVQPIPGLPETAAAADGSDAAADGAADERDAPTKRAFEMLTMVIDPLIAQHSLSTSLAAAVGVHSLAGCAQTPKTDKGMWDHWFMCCMTATYLIPDVGCCLLCILSKSTGQLLDKPHRHCNR